MLGLTLMQSLGLDQKTEIIDEFVCSDVMIMIISYKYIAPALCELRLRLSLCTYFVRTINLTREYVAVLTGWLNVKVVEC